MRKVALVVVVLVAVVIAIAVKRSRGRSIPELNEPHDVTIEIPQGNLYGGPSFGRQLDVSPDGKRIVYVGQAGKGSRQLFVQTIGETEPAGIPGTGAGNRDVRDPTFSPDGRYIAYWAQGLVKKTTLDGTSASVIGKATSTRGIGWLDSGTLVIGNVRGPLLKLSTSQEEPSALFDPIGPDLPHVSPQVLPGNKAVLFTVANAALTDARIWIINLKTGEKRQLFDTNAYAPRYVPSGHIMFGSGVNRELMAVSFDPAKLEIVGSAQPVLNVPLAGTGASGATDYTISEAGVLVYTPRIDPGGDTARALLGDPTQIHVRLHWLDELNRLMP
jgi:eukaryotic-like serine/threonine-protein kinase